VLNLKRAVSLFISAYTLIDAFILWNAPFRSKALPKIICTAFIDALSALIHIHTNINIAASNIDFGYRMKKAIESICFPFLTATSSKTIQKAA
jgi:hypothetical protein